MLKPLFALSTGTGVFALGLVLWAAPLHAQSNDLVGILNRLNRMEADLQTIHRQLAHGGTGTSAAAVAAAPAAQPSAALAPSQAADFEIRLSQLERSVRELVGKYEESVFGINQLRDRLDKLSSDMDFRLSQLDSHASASADTARPSHAPGAATPAPAQTPTGQGKTSTTTATALPAARPADKRGETTAPTQSQGSPGLGSIPGNIQEQYDEAFGLLRSADYDRAEKALSKFVVQHRDSPLAGNAQHWLGATFYVRGKYAEAAVAFAEGFQKYPKSNKAPDNLLKLGMSLGALGQKEDACKTLKQFTAVFPSAPASLKRQADSERKKLSCL